MKSKQPTLLVYVAGPYRGGGWGLNKWGLNKWAQTLNIHRAYRTGRRLAKLGVMPLIPHMNTAFMDGCNKPEFFLDGTLHLLSKCDAMVLVGSRKQIAQSEGTQGEIKYCMRYGTPYFYKWSEFMLWLNAKRSRVLR